MKNPYELYHIDNGTVSQRKQAKSIQRKVSSIINQIVDAFNDGQLNKYLIKKMKAEFDILPSESGIQDTMSRESVCKTIENKLIKAGCDKKKALWWGQLWWDC